MIKVAPTGQKDAVEMRKVYAGFVAKQIEAGSEIIALEADLMSSMAMDGVHKDHPERVINCGIMEANVIGVAAGLSLSGRVPFVHTFTAFASRRCFSSGTKNPVSFIPRGANIFSSRNSPKVLCAAFSITAPKISADIPYFQDVPG